MHTTPKLVLAGVAMLGMAALLATRNGQSDSGGQVDHAIGELEVAQVPREGQRPSKSDRHEKRGRSAARLEDRPVRPPAAADVDRSGGGGGAISSNGEPVAGGHQLATSPKSRAGLDARIGSGTVKRATAPDREPLARESRMEPNGEAAAAVRDGGRDELAPGEGMAYPAYSGTAGSWRALDMDHLRVRDGVTFRTDTDEPFSGRVVQALDDGVREERHYQDGLPHGAFSSYNASGRLQTREFFAMGNRDGVYTTHYPDGRRHFEAEIENGRQVGATTWDAKGQVRTKWRYDEQGRRLNLLDSEHSTSGGIRVRPGAN